MVYTQREWPEQLVEIMSNICFILITLHSLVIVFDNDKTSTFRQLP